MKYPKNTTNNIYHSTSTGTNVSQDIYNRMEGNNSDRKLVLYDDDINLLDDVIYSLIYSLGYSDIQAQQIAMIVHTTGNCVVKTGAENKIKRFHTKLKAYGLDVKIEE